MHRQQVRYRQQVTHTQQDVALRCKGPVRMVLCLCRIWRATYSVIHTASMAGPETRALPQLWRKHAASLCRCAMHL